MKVYQVGHFGSFTGDRQEGTWASTAMSNALHLLQDLKIDLEGGFIGQGCMEGWSIQWQLCTMPVALLKAIIRPSVALPGANEKR